jgi:hypothetical protein
LSLLPIILHISKILFIFLYSNVFLFSLKLVLSSFILIFASFISPIIFFFILFSLDLFLPLLNSISKCFSFFLKSEINFIFSSIKFLISFNSFSFSFIIRFLDSLIISYFLSEFNSFLYSNS